MNIIGSIIKYCNNSLSISSLHSYHHHHPIEKNKGKDMFDSISIITKTGIILYHNNFKYDNDTNINTPCSNTINSINLFLTQLLTSETTPSKIQSNTQQNKFRIFLPSSHHLQITVAQYEDAVDLDWIILALYPKVILDQTGGEGKWIEKTLTTVLKEFKLFYQQIKIQNVSSTSTKKSAIVPVDDTTLIIRNVTNNMHKFNVTFQVIWKQSESWKKLEKQNTTETTTTTTTTILGNDSHVSIQTQQEANIIQSSTTIVKSKSKKGKEDRVWHDAPQKVTSQAMAALDRSKVKSSTTSLEEDNLAALQEARATYLPSDGEIPLWEQEETMLIDDDQDQDDNNNDENNTGSSSSSGWGSSFKGLFQQISGNKILTESDLREPMQEMQKLLTSKNVASEIASEICNSVQQKLIGKRLTSMTRVKTAVRQALEVTLERILTPSNREIDVLRGVVTKRQGGSGALGSVRNLLRRSDDVSGGASTRPYVIVMVGINGVGKSTSLAKIAYYLKSNNCNPLIAACDTFRSGAVEQLNVHAKCLEIPLYHKGYAKDPAAVAKAAIEHATNEGNDVVLVDTAGRMQNNVPLMKALSNLVVTNKPDLVLFVCEALVGNDGIDQLEMFNRALKSGGHSRQIDGIVLTKFDTVSDKVGAALTMTHLTGAPVVFVGTGQKYNHLKKLSVPSVIQSLFS